MAGRSIEDILRQQAAQRQAQMQQQQAKERALYEQRERARQDYLERMRMYEKLSNINQSAAAAAAGGHSGKAVINGHAEFVLFKTSDLDNWQYVILDYLAETISGIKDTGVAKTESKYINLVENTGFIVEFDTKIVFINDNAEIIKTLDKTNFESSINRRNYYYVLLNDGTLYQFNGKVVTAYTGIPVGSDSTQLYLTKNGLVINTIESNANQDFNTYVWNSTNGLSTSLLFISNKNGVTNRFNGITCSDVAPFFSVAEYDDVADGWKTIHMFADDGTILSTLNVTSLASNLNTAFQTPTLLSENILEFSVHKGSNPQNNTYYFNIYDYAANTWRKSTHTKTNYANVDNALYQNQYDGSQYTSLSNGSVHLVYNVGGSTASAYNIDLYRYLDVVWSVGGSTFSSYVVNNTGTVIKGIDVNDANRDGLSNNSLYVGKSIFLPLINNDSKISLLCLTSTQSSVIPAATTAGLSGTQGDATKIPGWNTGQRYASFRVGDNFGLWLSYASGDVYKIYNEAGRNIVSLTMSTDTVLRYTGNLAVVSDNGAGIEYVFTSNTLGASPSYVTYSTLDNIGWYGIGSNVAQVRYSYLYNVYVAGDNTNPDWGNARLLDTYKTYTDDERTPSRMLNLNEGGPSRIITDTNVVDFTPSEYIWNKWTSDEYVVLEGRDNVTYTLFFYDWTGALLATVDTGVSTSLSYEALLIKDRIYFKVVDGTTTTYYYFSPTKSDSVSIENESAFTVRYDYWPKFTN